MDKKTSAYQFGHVVINKRWLQVPISKIVKLHEQTNGVESLPLAVMSQQRLDLIENPPPGNRSTHPSQSLQL